MNNTRARRIAEMFTQRGADFHAIICRLPQNVTMLTGYSPILGNSFCVVSLASDHMGVPISGTRSARDVEIRLAVPKDEEDLVPPGTAVEVRTFSEETMDYISNTIQAVRTPLAELLRSLGLKSEAVIGYEGSYSPIATGYTQVGTPGPATLDLLHSLFLGDYLRDATAMLDELASIKTEEELGFIRRSEEVGHQGFVAARNAIRVGATEADVAAATYSALLRAGYAAPGAQHVLPYVHVMAGARAALAYRAFNLTSNKTIERGDTVTVQMEISINGYWAELTRSFFAGTVSDEWRKAHQACMAAQDAALKSIHDGASARAVDSAARTVMQNAGFGAAFKHGLGHGFGFQAINHAAAPVLHPASKAVLRTGMVHNMEPAVYLEGKGGIRLNDNVAVKDDGYEVLSKSIPRDLDWLVVQE
ncbi:MAG: M24 family metallopeptidase [Ktedonobacteraceae bacterium]